MADPELLLHIGYHKTASSYLQSVVFPHPDLPFGLLHDNQCGIKYSVRLSHPFEFDAEGLRQTLIRATAELTDEERYPVYSSEGLSGFLHLGGFNSLQIKDRLKSIAPNAKILICIREQDSMLLSFHNQYVRRDGHRSVREFLTGGSNAYESFQKVHLAYHHLIGAYQEAFGKDRVMVLPFELLAADRTLFIRKILCFCQPGADWDTAPLPSDIEKTINPSFPSIGIAIKRRTNRFAAFESKIPIDRPMVSIGKRSNNKIKSWIGRIAKRLPSSWNDRLNHRYRQIIREEVGDYYLQSNRRTMEMTGLDLSVYGYRI